MKFEEYQEKLDSLKKLVEFGNTGRPAELAKKLNISERTARRMIERLRLQGYDVVFCRNCNSYILK
jgi:predicted DNA-binding transcriptional regulator YafY